MAVYSPHSHPPARPALCRPHWLPSGLRWQAEKEGTLCQGWALEPLASAQLPPTRGFLEAWPDDQTNGPHGDEEPRLRNQTPLASPGLPPAGSMASGTVP